MNIDLRKTRYLEHRVRKARYLEHRVRKTRFRWFGHVKRKDENSILRRVNELELEGRRPVGRPKKTWSEVVEKDIRKLNITEDMAEVHIIGGDSYQV